MLPYTLIRSKRRTLSIQINKHGELIIRAPMRMSVDFIENFIEKKQDWIIKHQIRLKSEGGSLKRKEYSEKEIQTMKQRLREYIVPRVQELWEGKNLQKYTNIKITKSEGRWGSCSARNGLCFSYRLGEYLNLPREMGADEGGGGLAVSEKSENQSSVSPTASQLLSQGAQSKFIDAIIVHELAHLREKNHQKPFWNLVYSMMPEYEQIMKTIKTGMTFPGMPD